MADRVNLNRLEALARAATPGPWEAAPNTLIGGTAVYPAGADHDGRAEVADFTSPTDAAYLATLDPQTMLALTAELRDTRQVVDAARGLLDILASPDPHFGWVKRQHAALADAVATHDRNAQPTEHDQLGSGG